MAGTLVLALALASVIYVPAQAHGCFGLSAGATDRAGDECSWYDGIFGACGHWDDEDFSAEIMCCECDGGVQHTTGCVDLSAGATDDAGDGCSWYFAILPFCGLHDDPDFSAETMCCECGGGLVVTQTCEWTTRSNMYSGGYASGVSTTFDVGVAFAKCQQLGSSCSAVTCQGSSCTVRESSVLRTSPSGEVTYVKGACPDCLDTDEDNSDEFGDSCNGGLNPYNNFPQFCGLFDDTDFSSSSMCCGCGGSFR